MNKIALNNFRSLTTIQRFNKISWNYGNPYNLRWQFKWKHAYYTYIKDGHEQTRTAKPQDNPTTRPIYWAYIQDILYRAVPQAQMWYDRRTRIYDTFQLYVLPFTSLFFYQFYDITLGFKMLTFLPLALFYTRLRDKTLDPDFKQTYLRQMIYDNAQIAKLFNEESIHVLDYDCEYDAGYPCEKKFPEFKNKLWRFFNNDTHMTTGFFKFGDLQSGAVMNLKFKTMPVPGRFKYQIGEPFHFYDLRAQITHNGVYKEVVIVDQNEQLKTMRPFLLII